MVEHLQSDPNHVEGMKWLPVRMTPELMNQYASRTLDGYLVRWHWSMDSDGWWTPTAMIDFENKLVDAEGC